MVQLREDTGVAARALELLVLTTARMKSKRRHRVPLSAAAVAVLTAAKGRSKTYVFPGHKRNGHLSNVAMLQVLRRLGRTGITVHGFRSIFRDWYAESTNYPAKVAELALAHTLRDKTEVAYRRGDLFEKTRADNSIGLLNSVPSGRLAPHGGRSNDYF